MYLMIYFWNVAQSIQTQIDFLAPIYATMRQFNILFIV